MLRHLPDGRKREVTAENRWLHYLQDAPALNVVKCAQQSEIRRTSRPNLVHKSQPDTYQPGRRSKSWLKIKSHMQQEAVIGGITEPSGSRKYFVYDRGKLRYVGHTGTGFSNEMLKDILKRLTPHFTDSCPFDPRPKDSARVQWVKPRLVCEVAFQEWTSDGKLRAPAFLGLREDKSPMEVVREHLAGPPKKVFPAQPK